MLDVRVMRSGWIFIGLLLLALVACAPNTLSRVGPLEPPSTVPESRTTAPDSTVTPKIEESGPFAWPEFAPAFIDYWRPPTEFYGSPTSGGTLRVSYGVPLDSANVWGSYNPASAGLRALVHNKLLEVDPYDSTRIIPDLARGWTVHDDGQGITFFLHSGVQWQNGLAFSCEDARFGLETLTTSTAPPAWN